MNRRNLLTRSSQAALGVGATALAAPFFVDGADAATPSGGHTHDEYLEEHEVVALLEAKGYLDEGGVGSLIDGKLAASESRLSALEAIVFAAPAPAPSPPTPTPAPTPIPDPADDRGSLPHYSVIRDCRYDGTGWMPSSHDAAGVVSYVRDPLGSSEMVARYESSGRAENWHSDHVANIDKDKSTFIYRGGFLFTSESFEDPPPWYIFRQWHNGSGSPAFSFQAKSDGTVRVIRRNVRSDGRENDETLASFSLSDLTGDWNDYSVLAIWSKGSDGRFQVKLNGKIEVDYTGPTLKPDASTMYGKNGGYHYGGRGLSFARRLFIGRCENWDERLHDAV